MTNSRALKRVNDKSNSKKYVLKNKKRFFSFIFIISVITILLVYTLSVSGYKDPQYKQVMVNSGDTLWSIAEKYGDNTDIRHFIYDLKEINNIDSGMLYANTTILVPIDD